MQLINVSIEVLFQALSDFTRIRILRVLAKTGEEACVCDLSESLDEPEYKISRHLKVLRQAGLLDVEKEGKWIYHRLVDNVKHLDATFELVKLLPDRDSFFSRDEKRFKTCLLKRSGARCRLGDQAIATANVRRSIQRRRKT